MYYLLIVELMDRSPRHVNQSD